MIITIIIVIILAATVILSISNNNPLSAAKQATFKTDVRSFQEELSMYIANNNMTGTSDSKINTNDMPTVEEMKKYISIFTSKYVNKLGIYNNELVYYKNNNEKVNNQVTDEEEVWLIELGIKKKVIETSVESFEWGSDDPNNSEYYTLTKYIGEETSIIVPKRCHKIGEKAFGYKKNIIKVELQSGITNIGKGAFAYCSELSSINLPEGITDIDEDAFIRCKKLNNITLPKSISEVGIGRSTFQGCEELTSIVIPDKVRFIDVATFMGCSNLKEVTLPEGLLGIYAQAFDGCTSLKNIKFPSNIAVISGGAFNNTALTQINIPKDVHSIGDGAFGACKALTNITVDNNNSYFIVQDKVLYDKAKTTIIQFPAGKTDTEFTIPSSVKKIFRKAFYGVDTIEKVNIPNTVTEIGYNVFHNCGNLKSVVIPRSVEIIESPTFYGSPNLTIYCERSETDIPSTWQKGWNGNVTNIVWDYTG